MEPAQGVPRSSSPGPPAATRASSSPGPRPRSSRPSRSLGARRPAHLQGPPRWVVERTLAWITRPWRTVRDYERLPAHHETYVYWAMIPVGGHFSPAAGHLGFQASSKARELESGARVTSKNSGPAHSANNQMSGLPLAVRRAQQPADVEGVVRVVGRNDPGVDGGPAVRAGQLPEDHLGVDIEARG